VALSPACAEQLGIELSAEDRKKPHVEVSGRKGQGVKGDDLLDRLESEARAEVQSRNPDLMQIEVDQIAHQIAVGALRFFLLKFTRTAIIAFDFREALNFDGETGPYLQYATVRGNNIIRKLEESDPSFQLSRVREFQGSSRVDAFLNESDDIWELVYTIARLDEILAQVVATQEPATLAKYAFAAAQRFSLFYHRYRILTEEDPEKRMFYILVVDFARTMLTRTLGLMGMQVPQRM
jgi:arginyl-tRNA synthetase